MLDTIEKICSIIGNCVTFALGCAAVYGFCKNRGKISLIFRTLRLSYLGERAKRLRETLGRLENLNYNDKENRSEVLALLGQAKGQLQPLIEENGIFEDIKNKISSYLDSASARRCFSEPIKREIVHSIYSAIDSCEYDQIKKLPNSRV